MNEFPSSYNLESSVDSDGNLLVCVTGKMDLTSSNEILDAFSSIIKKHTFSAIQLDISAVTSFDTSAAAILIDLMKQSMKDGIILTFTGNTEKFDNFLQMLDMDDLVGRDWEHTHKRTSFPVYIGEEVIEFFHDTRDIIVFLGGLLHGLYDAVRHPGRIRWSELFYFMEQSGSNALPIVALISFLIGFVMAYQSASQFQQYGAEIYVADLIGLIITRELGPVMVAIIIAGRSGGAFSAEIGTMKVSEEIDALSVMGFDTFRFLITPKIIALNLMLPCLTLLGDIIGIAGGLLVGVTTLNLTFTQYMNETYLAVGLSDISFGLVKSVIFGFLIAGIGCYRGMQVTGGADSVGRQTTSAVVTSIFAIIFCDALFAVVGNYVPWF